METVKRNLRKLIDSKDMTLSEFSEFVDLPNETVRSILYGKCNDCKLSTIVQISEHCHILMEEVRPLDFIDKDDLYFLIQYLHMTRQQRLKLKKCNI